MTAEEETMDSQASNLTPAELLAIEEHKYYLSQRRGCEVSIEEAIEDFLRNYSNDWKREKTRRDNQEQLNEIDKYKYVRSMAEGRDIGRAAAAEEWCRKYAPIWREERESLARNGFRRIDVSVKDPHGIHVRPTSEMAKLATQYDCDVYVHKEGMVYYNFMLGGKPYMNVKSILGMLSLGIILGDELEFIAVGAQAEQALDAIAKVIRRNPVGGRPTL